MFSFALPPQQLGSYFVLRAGWLLNRSSYCRQKGIKMPRLNFYDEIELEDLSYDEERDLFHYPCPCGDRFEITRQQLKDAEDVAKCPSCSLIIRVIFDPVSLQDE